MILGAIFFYKEVVEYTEEKFQQEVVRVANDAGITMIEYKGIESIELEVDENNSYIDEDEIFRYGGYAYSQLSVEDQFLYLEIYEMIKERKTGITISTVDEVKLDHIYYCVMNDHPQFYYVNGYSGMKYMKGEEITSIEIYPEYYMSEIEIMNYQVDIDRYVKEYVEQVPAFATEYEIAKQVYEYVVLTTQYNIDAPLNQTICSVATYGESVCQGYAESIQYLLNELGIFATTVTGVVKTGENHAWNLVKVDGEYYYMDATWGDPEYDVGDEEETPTMPVVNYDYLLLSEEQIGITHTLNPLVPMPECNSTKANYYRMEDLYFETYDKERLQQLIHQVYDTSQTAFSFQCSSPEVYDLVFTHLIEEGEIFDMMLEKKQTLVFSSDDSSLVLTVWLD